MNRRGFLTALAGGAAVLADPERLLWVPGAKKIFIPPVKVFRCADFRIGDEITFGSDPQIYRVVASSKDSISFHAVDSFRGLDLNYIWYDEANEPA